MMSKATPEALQAVIDAIDDGFVRDVPTADIARHAIDGYEEAQDEKSFRISVSTLDPVIKFFGYNVSEAERLGYTSILIELSDPGKASAPVADHV